MDPIPHDAAGWARYGLAFLLLLVAILRVRYERHHRTSDFKSDEHLRREAFRQAKEREGDRGWNN